MLRILALLIAPASLLDATNLSSEDWATREAATTRLSSCGVLALPALAAADEPDAEGRRRAEMLRADAVGQLPESLPLVRVQAVLAIYGPGGIAPEWETVQWLLTESGAVEELGWVGATHGFYVCPHEGWVMRPWRPGDGEVQTAWMDLSCLRGRASGRRAFVWCKD